MMTSLTSLARHLSPAWSCPRCEVAWKSDRAEPCWVCGRPGTNGIPTGMFMSPGAAYYCAADAERYDR